VYREGSTGPHLVVAAPIPAHAPVTRIVEYSMRTAFLSDEADSDEGRQTGR
jgi:hypothetical protein